MTIEVTVKDYEPTEVTEFIKYAFGEHVFEQTGKERLILNISCTENNTLIGTVRCIKIAKEFHLSEIIVLKGHRGRGIGTTLMERSEKLAKDLGCNRIHVDTYTYQAEDYYPKFGFTEIGRLKNYRDTYDRVFFEKRI